MGHKSGPQELEMYRAVDEVLFYFWDPIGVSRLPDARDEYHSYLPQVNRLLKEASTASEIADYLSSVTEHMGLTPDPHRDAEVVKLLVSWRDAINERYA